MNRSLSLGLLLGTVLATAACARAAEDATAALPAAQAPAARGLVLPGMPAGSPGMEMPDGYVQPYTVELVRTDGSIEAFAEHGQGG